jgi:hypothetical protein
MDTNGFQHTHPGYYYPNDQSTVVAICPVQLTGSESQLSNSTIKINYTDGNDDSTVGGMYCWVVALDASYNAYYGATKHSCGTAGGCTAANPAYRSSLYGADYLILDAPSSGTWIDFKAYCTLPGSPHPVYFSLKTGIQGVSLTTP